MAVRNILQHQSLLTHTPASASSLLPHLFIHFCRNFSGDNVTPAATVLEKHGARTVEVFWDMDNKPPLAMAPVQTAKRLKELAARFGSLVNVVIYASKHSLKHLPLWAQERKRLRQPVDQIRAKGEEEEVYVCEFCGRRSRSNSGLQKHFKQLHEKEHERRLSELGSMKKRGKRNSLIRSEMQKKEERFRDVAKTVSLPDKGYGLAAELQRAGTPVVAVSNKPNAAAVALQKHMLRSVAQGINCVWLVSHDTRFIEVLEFVRQKQLHAIVTSENQKLQNCADICFSWGNIVSRIGMVDADETAYLWSLEDSLRGPPSHTNFLTTELTQISARKDLRTVHAMQNMKDDQTMDSDSDQFESTSDSASELDSDSSNSNDDEDFSIDSN